MSKKSLASKTGSLSSQSGKPFVQAGAGFALPPVLSGDDHYKFQHSQTWALGLHQEMIVHKPGSEAAR